MQEYQQLIHMAKKGLINYHAAKSWQCQLEEKKPWTEIEVSDNKLPHWGCRWTTKTVITQSIQKMWLLQRSISLNDTRMKAHFYGDLEHVFSCDHVLNVRSFKLMDALITDHRSVSSYFCFLLYLTNNHLIQCLVFSLLKAKLMSQIMHWNKECVCKELV